MSYLYLKNATLFDGTEADPKSAATVVVDGKKIERTPDLTEYSFCGNF